MPKRCRLQAGQASVELLATVPVLLLLLALVVQAGLAGWTLWSTQNAARAGARAAAVGGDVAAAARSALPNELRARASVGTDGAVRVRVAVPRIAAAIPAFDVQAGGRFPGAADDGG